MFVGLVDGIVVVLEFSYGILFMGDFMQTFIVGAVAVVCEELIEVVVWFQADGLCFYIVMQVLQIFVSGHMQCFQLYDLLGGIEEWLLYE